MNFTQAKEVLLLDRPGRTQPETPELSDAKSLAGRDPDLRIWFERHTAFQRTLTRSFQGIPVPENLCAQLLAHARVVQSVAWYQRPAWWAAAAAFVLLLGLAALWQRSPAADSFATFRSRMTRSVLRQYTMDIVTNDMSEVRRFLASRQAPSDYALPQGLARLPVSGAGVLSWQGQRVAMVCLDSQDQGTLFLFIVDQSTIAPAPPAVPEFAQVSRLTTASWSLNGKTYVLAGTGGAEALRRHL